ncbi:hypothetical protein Zm00014a_005638 [Zea mays]|uniref:DUF4283 domain-containing protein n=1 Tax=Zea mays TaxID=4577 RepID=A0A3L6GCL2_MAIZE|nr:hypothetical protein Zm00014a_005638 [Zea mays]
MALGGDHGDRGGGRGQHQSNGVRSHASGNHQHGDVGGHGHLPGQVQGTGLGRGGNQPVFHTGYGGGDRSAARRGGVRGRPAAWRGGRGQRYGVTVSPPVAPGVSKAAHLLHQAFAAANGGGGAARNVPDNTWEQIVTLLQQSVGTNQSMSNSRWDAAGMDHRPQLSSRLYTIKELYKPTHVDDKVGSTVTHVAKEKVPFCFRCKTKGHQSSDSNIELFCEVCNVKTYLTSKCPVVHASRTFVVPCGYTVEGLGFYYIPQPNPVKPRKGGCNGTVTVVEDSLTEEQIMNELKRLVSSEWEWREDGEGEEIKYEMTKIWVQFTGLPKELRECSVIKEVGSMLGISNEVDMVFTRKFDRARMQVAVLDPNLIPQFIHVVIGDYLYELKFKVEVAGDGEQPTPMDMDHFGANDDDEFHEQNKDDNLGDKGNSRSKLLETSKGSARVVNKVSASKHCNNNSNGKSLRVGYQLLYMALRSRI